MNGLAPKRMDWSLTGTILALLTISILFIYSAQFQATGSVGSTWQRQLFFGGAGFGLYLLTAWFDYRVLIRWVGWLYPIIIGLLLLVFLSPPSMAPTAGLIYLDSPSSLLKLPNRLR